MMWVKVEEDGSIKSSVSKFYTEEELRTWTDRAGAQKGDLMLILAGPTMKTRKQLCELRLEMGSRLGLRDPQNFSCLWVVDFPSSSGTKRHSVTTPCITPSPPPTPTTSTCSTPTQARCAPLPMTWWSTATSSAAAPYVSMRPNCRTRCSACSA